MDDKILRLEEELNKSLANYTLMLKDLEDQSNGEDIDILMDKDKQLAVYLISAQTSVVVIQGILGQIKEIKEEVN